jgi:hypothetical protein
MRKQKTLKWEMWTMDLFPRMFIWDLNKGQYFNVPKWLEQSIENHASLPDKTISNINKKMLYMNLSGLTHYLNFGPVFKEV